MTFALTEVFMVDTPHDRLSSIIGGAPEEDGAPTEATRCGPLFKLLSTMFILSRVISLNSTGSCVNNLSKSRLPIIAVCSLESNLTNSSSKVTMSSFGKVGSTVGLVPGTAGTGIPGSSNLFTDEDRFAASSKNSLTPDGKTSTVVAVVFMEV